MGQACPVVGGSVREGGCRTWKGAPAISPGGGEPPELFQPSREWHPWDRFSESLRSSVPTTSEPGCGGREVHEPRPAVAPGSAGGGLPWSRRDPLEQEPWRRRKRNRLRGLTKEDAPGTGGGWSVGSSGEEETKSSQKMGDLAALY